MHLGTYFFLGKMKSLTKHLRASQPKRVLRRPAAARKRLPPAKPALARRSRQQEMPPSEDSSTGLQTPDKKRMIGLQTTASAMARIFQPAATINVLDLSDTERESTVPAPAPAAAQAEDETAANIDGEAANNAEVDETTAHIDETAADLDSEDAEVDEELQGRGQEPNIEELFDQRPLTEETLQKHRASLTDRQPSRATSTALQGDAAAVPAEKAPSVLSLLDTMPPGSEAGLSFAATTDTFDSRTATRSQASTRSCGHECEDILPLCTKCGYPTEVFNAKVTTKATAEKSAKYVCRPCNNIQTMMYRNVKQQGSLKMSTWNDELLQEFYRQAQEEMQQHQKDGKNSWLQIREVMKKCLVKRYIEKTKKQILSEFKPLGVWGTLGYDVEMIAAFNKTEWNPACGMCYAVPLKSICWTKQEEEIEEHIAKAEFQRKGQTEAGADDSNDEDTSPAKGREAKRRKLEADKAKEAAEATREAKKEQAKEQNAVKSHNSKMHILASKTVTALPTGCESLKKAAQSRNYRSAPTFLAEKIERDVDTAVGYLKEADNVLKLMKKCAKDGTRLPEMSFNMKDLSDVCRAVKKGKTDFDAFEKLCRSQ
jgi:hypothetical protein